MDWLIVFSEVVTGVDRSDFEVISNPDVDLTVSFGPVPGVPTQYVVSAFGGALADYDGMLTLDLNRANDITDMTGNPLVNVLPADIEFYIVDNTAPTATLTGPDTYVDASFEISIVFSEPIMDFTNADIRVRPRRHGDDINLIRNATVSALTPDNALNIAWTATVTPGVFPPDRRREIILDLDEGVYEDRAGNPNVVQSNLETIDYTEPKITLMLSSGIIREAHDAPAYVSATIDPPSSVETRITVTPTPTPPATADHYSTTGNTLTVAANTTASDRLSIIPRNDDVINANRIITINAAAVAGGGAVTFANADALPLTLTIADDDLDVTPPQLVSITRSAPLEDDTNADTLAWLVIFNEPVDNVAMNTFEVVLPEGETGTATTATVTDFMESSGSDGRLYVFTASGGNLNFYNGKVGLALADGHTIQDRADTPNALVVTAPTGVNETYTVDNTAPTVTITNPPTEFVDAPFQVTITFSESVENFNINAITVANAAPSSLSGSGDTYMVTITPDTAAPNARQDIIIDSIGAGAARDLAGNSSQPLAIPVTVAYNEPMITLMLAPASIQENGGSSGAAMLSATIDPVAATDTIITVTLDPQGGAMAGDYMFPNTTLTIFAGMTAGNSLTITAVNNNANNANRVINIGATATGGAVTFANDPPLPLSLTIVDDEMDTTPPRLASIARMTPPEDEPTNMDTLTWLVTFSEGVTGVDADDFRVTGTPLVSLIPTVAAGADARIYQVSVTGPALADYNGTLTLALVSSGEGIQDLSVNPGANSLSNPDPTGDNETYTVDNTAPAISTIARVDATGNPVDSMDARTNAGTLRWRVTFSEAVTVDNDDFSITFTDPDDSAHTPATAPTVTAAMGADATIWDLSATGGDLAAFNGAVAPAVASGHGIRDTAGNALTNATPGAAESWTLDNAAPTATFIVPPNYNLPFPVTITFNEPVTDFDDVGDVTATNATVSTPTPVGGSDTEYTVTVTPDGSEQPIMVTLAANAATDLAGNMNAAQTAASTSTFQAPVVTLALSPASIPENGGETTVTATIAPAATADTTITVSAAAVDPAAPGDFTLSATVELMIAANATASTGEVTITANDNNVDAADKTVMVTGTAASTATVTGPAAQTLTITDDDLPTVSVTANTSEVAEGSAAQDVFEITREGQTAAALTVRYNLSVRGVARNNQTIEIPTGETSVMVPVDLSNDTLDTVNTVQIMLVADAANYNLGATTTTRPIADDESPQDVLSTTLDPDSTLISAGGGSLTFTIEFRGDDVTIDPASFIVDPAAAGTLSDFAVDDMDASMHTAVFTTGDTLGDFTITLPADGYESTAGGAGSAPITIIDGEIIAELTGTITGPAFHNRGELEVTIEFSEPIDPESLRSGQITSDAGSSTLFTDSEGIKAIAEISGSNNRRFRVTRWPTNKDSLEFQMGINRANSVANPHIHNVSRSNTLRVGYDGDAPTIASILRQIPSDPDTDAIVLTFRVTFSESVTAVDATDFIVSGDPDGVSVTGAVAVNPETRYSGQYSNEWDVTVTLADEDTYPGTIGLGLAGSRDIRDEAGNALGAALPSGEDNQTFVRLATGIVTLALTPSSIAEGATDGTQTATVTATIAPAVVADTTIMVSAAAVEPAVAGDFTLSDNVELVIPANTTESTGVVTITAVDNEVDAPDKTVMVTGTADSSVTVTGPAEQTLTITDDDLPTVEVTADDSEVDEGTESQTVFTITRVGQTAAALTVRYHLSVRGVAMNDQTIEIPTGETSVGVELDLSNEALDTMNTVQITLVADAAYDLGDTTTATRPIADDEALPVLDEVTVNPDPRDDSLMDLDSAVVSAGGGTLTFTIAFTGDNVTIDTTRFSVTPPGAGTLSAFAADETNKHTMLFTAGDTPGDFTITLPADGYRNAAGVEGLEPVTITGEVVAALTATITGPAFHDGTNFDITIEFSESIVPASLAANFGAMARDLTDGSDTDAVAHREVAGSNNTRFLITLRPDRNITFDVLIRGQVVNSAAHPHIRNIEKTNVLEIAYDGAAPTIERILRQNPSGQGTAATDLTFRVTFDEGVTAVDAADFTVLTATGNITRVAAVSPETRYDGEQYSTSWDVTVTLADDTYEGAVGLGLDSTQDIRDEVGNDLDATAPTGADNQVFERRETSLVTLILTPASIPENGGVTTVTASIDPAVLTETTITVSAAAVDPAVAGDFTLSDDVELVIPANATASTGVVTITANDNDADAADKMVTVMGTVAGGAINDPVPQTLTITDDDLPMVGVMDDDSAVAEGTGSQPVFTITRAGQTTAPLTVQYTITERGETPVNGMVDIPTGMTSVEVAVDLSNDTFDGATTVGITLVADAANYNLGAATTATRPITDDPEDKQAITAIAVTPDPVTEEQDITVTLTRGNLAFNGLAEVLDGVGVSVNRDGIGSVATGTVNFTGGDETASATITIPDNDSIEVDYEVTVTVQANDAYDIAATIGSGDSVTVTDNNRTNAAGAPLLASLVRMTPSSEHTNADALTWLVTFNEHVTGVEGADFMATGLTNPGVSVNVDADDLVLSVEVAVTGGGLDDFDGAVSLQLATGATIEDGSGTELDSAAAGHAASESYMLDNTAPTATFTVPDSYNPPFPVTITFDEPVTDFDDVGDVTATFATMVSAPAPAVSGSTTMYTAMVTPDGSENEIEVALAANAATDRAGNMSAAQTATSTSTFQATVVTLELDDNSISENGGMATVTATIAPAATVDTTITVSAAAVDPAVAGDFTLSTNAVLSIAMGATESTGTVTIAAVDNTADSNDKEVMVTATVTGATTAAPAPLTLTIEDDDLPTVSVMADTSAVDEGTASANVFTITRAGLTTAPLTVQYTITERGETPVNGMVDIPTDETSVMVAVDLSNDTFDGATTVGITLVADADAYNLGATTSTTRPITDNDKQEITAIAVTPDPVMEGEVITVTLTRGNLAFSGQAETLDGVMVQVVVGTQTAQPLTVAFAANSLTGSATFTIPDNSVVENDYQVTATVQTNAAYDIASGLTGGESVAVTDNDDRVDDPGAPAITSLVRHNPTSESTNADSLTWRVMFNEHVTGVEGADFMATGLTNPDVSVSVDGAALASDALTRSVDVTVTGGGLANLNGAVSLELATDAMIRDGEDENDLTAALPATAESYTVDNTAPTISTIARRVPSSGTRTNVDTLGWRVTFNEAVTVDNDDFSITFTNPDDSAHTPATAPTVTAAMGADGTIWDLTATGGDLADFDGAVVAAVATGHGIADTATNGLTNTTPGSAESWTVDNTAPALTAIAAPDAGSNNEVGTNAEIDIDFTFDAGDLDVASLSPTISPAGNEITDLTQDSTDPMKYTGKFEVGSEPGTVTITLTGYRDDVGNQGTATQTLTLTIVDRPTPTLSAAQRYVVNNGVIPVTISFDQDVTGFDAVGDIEVVGGTATAPTAVGGSASEYTTMITSTADPTTVIVEANMAMSVATGENNVASNELEFTREPSVNTPTHKVGAPRLASVAIPSDKNRSEEILKQNDTLEFVITFDEAVLITSVECEDFAPPSGFECTRVQAVVGATLAQSDSDYATQFDLTYTLTGEANRAIQDVAVVLSSARTITDQTGELLTGTQASGDSAEHEEIAVDTSALATTLMDVAATGLAVSLVSDGALSPPSDTVEVRFGESATYDPNAEGALELEGATLESAVETRAGFIWTLTLRLDPGVTEVIVTVPAGQVTDARGDMNVAVAKTFAVSQSQSEREMIADFMQRRASQIMAARPDFIGLLDGSGIGTSSLKLDDGPTRTFAFAGTGSEIAGLFGKTSRGLSLNEADRAAAQNDAWVSLKGIRTRTDTAEDDFYSLSAGVHRRMGTDGIIGGFIAVDQSDTDGRGESGDGWIDGRGWLVGPYLVGRLADRSLYYQVHAAWGQSSNDISANGVTESSFDTERYLLGGALKGSFQAGPWTLTPALSADWFREEQDAYTSGGARVEGQEISLGEIRVGPEFRRVVHMNNGADLSLKMGARFIHNLEVDADSDTSTFAEKDTRGRLDFDFGYALGNANLGLGLRYDGIGQTDYESWGADLRVRVAF